MSLTVYFTADIRHTGITEMTQCLEALYGRSLLLRDQNTGLYYFPENVYFCKDPKDDRGWNKKELPFGHYAIMDPLTPEMQFTIDIRPDDAIDDYAAGNRITVHAFQDKPYDENTDFRYLKEMCRHMGYSSFFISDEYTGKETKDYFNRETSVYFKEIRDGYPARLAHDISAILAKSNDMMPMPSDKVDAVYDRMEDRRNDGYHYTYQRVLVKGFISSGMDKEQFINALKHPDRVDHILDTYAEEEKAAEVEREE